MLRPGQMVVVCVVALLTLGVIMVNSAVMAVAPVELNPIGPVDPAVDDRSLGALIWSIIASRWTVYMALALIALFATSLLPITRLTDAVCPTPRDGEGAPADEARSAPRSRPYHVLLVGTAALLVVLSMAYWPGLGREVNGARRWFYVPVPGAGSVSVQPSEIAKWGLVVLMAWYGAMQMATGAIRSLWTGLIPGLAAAGIVAAGVAHEDLGTGVLIGLVACGVLLAAGARLWHFLLWAPAAVGGFVALVIINPYRIERLTTFLDPYRDPQDSGYHMIQSMAAVAGGEGFGRGLGHGLQKFGYLVEDHTDFLYAVICEELGIAGAAGVLAIFAILLWACASIVRRQERVVLKLVALGVMATIGLQAVINVAVVTGLAPTKGIALPLVSAGGTGWILTAASLGLLVAMDRSRTRPSEPQPDPDFIPALAAVPA